MNLALRQRVIGMLPQLRAGILSWDTDGPAARAQTMKLACRVALNLARLVLFHGADDDEQ